MLPCSSSYPLEQIGWGNHQQSELGRGGSEVGQVVGNQSISPAVHGRFQDHLIIWVRELWSPSKPNVDRLDGGCQGGEGAINPRQAQAGDAALLWPLQHVLVLQEQR